MTAACNASLYRAHGLLLESDVPLADLPLARPGEGEGQTPDVTIRLLALGPLSDNARDAGGIRFAAAGDLLSFEVPDVARFRIVGPARIEVDPAPGASVTAITAILAGTAMAAVALNRDMLPLHASCVATAGGAAAFVGPSGMGKSTIAGHLAALGWTVLADDLCLIQPDPAGGAHVSLGMRRIKLWGDAADRLGLDVEQLAPLATGMAKYHVPLDMASGEAEIKLRAIYRLDPADPAAEESIRPLSGAEAVHSLIEQTYRPELLKVLGAARPHLIRCSRLVRDVPCFARARSADASDVAADSARLDTHLRAIIRP